MCGIAGFNWKDKSLIRKMSSVLVHRGPDDTGMYTDNGVSFGHRRLSIIDVTKKGHQPMTNKEESVVVVFNGEIWNFRELKKILSRKYSFKSNSDTEVIVHGYEEYGIDICSKLEGMFAIALWDKKKKRLILARDSVGKKPLYYAINKRGVIFASEIKAILQSATIAREINNECLSEYTTFRYSTKNDTVYTGIRKLRPGYMLVVERNKPLREVKFGYSFMFGSGNAEQKKIDSLIESAIKKRLLSDVPIGVFLSGGLDSSTIVAYMSRFTKDIRTFSVSFDSRVDESPYAQIIAKKFKTRHTKISIDKEMLKYLPQVVWHFDEPLADPAALPMFLLCKEVSKHVKVAMSGEGGDETFGGYDSYNAIPYLEKIYAQPRFVRRALGILADVAAARTSYPQNNKFRAIARLVQQEDIRAAFKELFYFPFTKEEKENLIDITSTEDSFDILNKNIPELHVAAQTYYYNEWLPNNLLMKADKMGMAHGLEIRTPFLDKEITKYFASLNFSEKHNRKAFRQVVSCYLPKQIMDKKKQGFTVPLYEWFSEEKTFNRVKPFLNGLKKRGIFNRSAIDHIIRSRGKFKNEHQIWTLLNLELWFQIFIDGKDYRKIIL